MDIKKEYQIFIDQMVMHGKFSLQNCIPQATGAAIRQGCYRLSKNVTVQDGIYQVGRVWVASTKWTNKSDNTDYELITGQVQEKTLISQLNHKLIFNHTIKSGNKVNVTNTIKRHVTHYSNNKSRKQGH